MRLPARPFVVAALLLAACGGPVPSASPARPTTTPSAIQTSTFPPTSPPTPTASPAPSPTGLHVNGLARVVVARLRQLADPEDPRNDAFESPLGGMTRYLAPLPRDAEVFLIDGPRLIDGREFWKVADESFVGCCAPLGWIPTTSQAGEPTIEPVSPECPNPSETLFAFTFPRPSQLGVLSCFGRAELHIRGVLTCSQPTVDASYFVRGAPWIQDTDQPRLCELGDDPSYPYRVYGDAVTALLDAPNYGGYYKDFVDLTGHFDDPAADRCFWAPGNLYMIDVTGAPTESAEFTCRNHFVVTDVRSV